MIALERQCEYFIDSCRAWVPAADRWPAVERMVEWIRATRQDDLLDDRTTRGQVIADSWRFAGSRGLADPKHPDRPRQRRANAVDAARGGG